MMKIKRLALLKSVAGLLAGCIAVSLPVGCVPVPSYSVDPYVGSLNQCLNIEGTYENENFYRNYPNGFVNLSVYFSSKFPNREKGDKNLSLWERTKDGKKTIFIKAWITFRILDSQHLEATIFNVEGQSLTITIDMLKKNVSEGKGNRSNEEEFICTSSSWQRSSSMASSTEGHRRKWRTYSKTTKLANGTLRVEAKNDTWGGAFGLYMPDSGVDRIGYFRKVDLTVDDIRAGNEKARRAIEQYDQVATTPPPQ